MWPHVTLLASDSPAGPKDKYTKSNDFGAVKKNTLDIGIGSLQKGPS